ncbi:hypothetical protein CHUAL_012108 [Chamberlinius hualienensis]
MWAFGLIFYIFLIKFVNGENENIDNFNWEKGILTAAKLILSKDTEDPQFLTKQVVNVVINLIDNLKQRILIKKMDKAELDTSTPGNVAIACLAMLKTYVRITSTDDEDCVKRFLCEGNQEAVTYNPNDKISNLIAKYASYFIINNDVTKDPGNLKAAKLGRRYGRSINCHDKYRLCYE